MNEAVPYISNYIDSIIQAVPYFKTEIILSIGFLCSIFGSLFLDKIWKNSSFAISIISYVLAAYCNYQQYDALGTAFFNMLHIDRFGLHAKFMLLLALIVSSILIQQHFQHSTSNKRKGDIYTILLGSSIGMSILCMTSHWLMAFIGIEMVSISSYILIGYFAETKKQTEAAMKYALFGSACAAIMLYGLSLIYGFTGVLDFADQKHMQGLIDAPKVMSGIALLFVLTGIGFKLSFVPFHLWSPDVYEGAPTPVAAFLSTAPKIAAIILFSRLIQAWGNTLFYFSEILLIFIVLVAIVSMLAGNLIALRQQNVKRMMAYSSIGHTGFLLMAALGYMTGHQEALLFYLAIYTFMNLAAFAFIDLLEKQQGNSNLSSYSGLGKQLPILFTLFSFVGISLVGLPPSAGFVGKLFVFSAIFERYQQMGDMAYIWLLIIGALTSVISLFYYFKIPLYAFLKSKTNESVGQPIGWTPSYLVAILLSLLLLLFGLFPSLLMQLF